jgi:hypothetical protein
MPIILLSGCRTSGPWSSAQLHISRTSLCRFSDITVLRIFVKHGLVAAWTNSVLPPCKRSADTHMRQLLGKWNFYISYNELMIQSQCMFFLLLFYFTALKLMADSVYLPYTGDGSTHPPDKVMWSEFIKYQSANQMPSSMEIKYWRRLSWKAWALHYSKLISVHFL